MQNPGTTLTKIIYKYNVLPSFHSHSSKLTVDVGKDTEPNNYIGHRCSYCSAGYKDDLRTRYSLAVFRHAHTFFIYIEYLGIPSTYLP
jgi:hypothetical protein